MKYLGVSFSLAQHLGLLTNKVPLNASWDTMSQNLQLQKSIPVTTG
jgi:hypothetical protein